jgi:DNA-binding NarL/FixJ family response regulator
VLDHEVAAGMGNLVRVRQPSAARPFPELTDREFEILDLVAEGLDNGAIARRLVLSPKTVRNHVSNVFTKIGAADRAQAIVLGRRQGLGEPDSR